METSEALAHGKIDIHAPKRYKACLLCEMGDLQPFFFLALSGLKEDLPFRNKIMSRRYYGPGLNLG